MKTQKALKRSLSISLIALSSLAFANKERIKDDEALEKAFANLVKTEKIARLKTATPDMPEIAKAEYENLLKANTSFKEFIAYDCMNEVYHEGAVGGSAADTTQCETKRVNARIIELAKRYDIKLVYKKNGMVE